MPRLGKSSSVETMPYPATVNRACEACNRKKVKCDMTRPTCGLCQRMESRCTFPVRRKPVCPRTKTKRDGVSLQKSSYASSSIAAPVPAPASFMQFIETTPPGRGRSTTEYIFSNLTPPADTLPLSAHNQEPEWHLHQDTGGHDAGADAANNGLLASSGGDPPGLTPSETHRSGPGSMSPVAHPISATGGSLEVRVSDNGWDLPPDVAIELIDLFFANIQPWLPLFHRPLFSSHFTRPEGSKQTLVNRNDLSDDAAFMILSMCAMSSRFSKSAVFQACPVFERGKTFASCAATVKDRVFKTLEEPSLDFVRGLVLLAFNYVTSGELTQGSVLTSVCVRFAYDLGLDQIDADQLDGDTSGDDDALPDSDEWVRKEELRRLWWTIYDLDAFVSTLSCHPYGIDRAEMKVCLPVSDDQWQSGQPLRSPMLDTRPNVAWRTLQGSPNRNPRAWYLVANNLKCCMVTAGRQRRRMKVGLRADLESALCCFKLALPAEFHLGSLYINDDNVGEGIWIISTHLMILACESILSSLTRLQLDQEGLSLGEKNLDPTRKRIGSYMVDIAQAWPSQYIPLTSPLMTCAVVVPGSLYIQQFDPAPQYHDLSTLVLSHFARYWKLGNNALRVVAFVRKGFNPPSKELELQDRDMVRRFSLLLPPPRQKPLSPISPNCSMLNPGSVQFDSGVELSDPGGFDPFQWPFEVWTSSNEVPIGGQQEQGTSSATDDEQDQRNLLGLLQQPVMSPSANVFIDSLANI